MDMNKGEQAEYRTIPRLHGYLPEASLMASCFGGALLLFGAIMLGNANDRQVTHETLAEEYHIPTALLGGFTLGVGVALLLFAALAYVKMRRTAARAVQFA